MSNIHICEFYKGKIVDITTDSNLNPYCRRCGKLLRMNQVDRKWKDYINKKLKERSQYDHR